MTKQPEKGWPKIYKHTRNGGIVLMLRVDKPDSRRDGVGVVLRTFMSYQVGAYCDTWNMSLFTEVK